ncbi:hypothetical protein [Corynebacterium aurimucosum]
MGVAAQALVVGLLRQALDVRVATKMPDPEPDRFIIVSRIGGGGDTWATKAPRFLIECWATSELEAEKLADDAWDAWGTFRTDQITWSAPDNNLTQYDDPDSRFSRFQFTATLQYKRTA